MWDLLHQETPAAATAAAARVQTRARPRAREVAASTAGIPSRPTGPPAQQRSQPEAGRRGTHPRLSSLLVGDKRTKVVAAKAVAHPLPVAGAASQRGVHRARFAESDADAEEADDSSACADGAPAGPSGGEESRAEPLKRAAIGRTAKRRDAGSMER